MPQNLTQEITEQKMVTFLCQGRPEALGWIYDKYASVLTGLANRILGNKEKAEAVLQASFVAIWQRKNTFDPDQLRLLTWLILITRDIAKAALGSEEYSYLNSKEHSSEFSQVSNNTGSTTYVDNKIKESFCYLGTDERAALDLVYLKGYICADAAAELGIPLETLKDRLKMAGKHLREGKT